MHPSARILRAQLLGQRLPRWGSPRAQQQRRHAASAPAGPEAAPAGKPGASRFWLPPAVAAALTGAAAALGQFRAQVAEAEALPGQLPKSSAAVKWMQEVAEEPGTVQVLTADMLLENDHPFMEDDHMFSAFVSKGIVDDIVGYYNSGSRRFYTVVTLGREVCGFPRIVHGGLTAAMFDESFGGLLFALKRDKVLKFWGPAYTVSLEVAYKHKVAAGRTVLLTTEVESAEGRKVWMTATMSDGPGGKVFATARALFVAPKPAKLVSDVGKYLFQRVFGSN